MGRLSREKINEKTPVIGHIRADGLIDTYRTFHPKAVECILFSSVCGTFFRIDHMVHHKASLKKLNTIVIISSIFSSHKTEIRNQL